jgi:hypothetical protein
MIWILLPFALWGLFDIYICYRWVRKPEIDTTAGVSTYWWTKWLSVTKSKQLAEKLGYPGQDLSEALRIIPDDGEVT